MIAVYKHKYSFLVNDQRDAQFFSTRLFQFLTLYMFWAQHAHHQERQIVSIQPLVAVSGRVMCRSDLHMTRPPTEWQLPEVVLTQSLSPDDEHIVLKTCRGL